MSALHHVIEIEDDSCVVSTDNSCGTSANSSFSAAPSVQLEIETITEDATNEAKDASKTKSLDKSKACRVRDPHLSYAANKNIADGLMDIALLSANANQLRFLITYNNTASTYFISIGLVAVSLTLQVAVGIALIFKRRMKQCNSKKYHRTNEFLISGVFIITVVNILLAAFTTTDGRP